MRVCMSVPIVLLLHQPDFLGMIQWCHLILHEITRTSHFISLKTNKCARSYGTFKLHAPGDVTQYLSWALTLCVLIQILICKVFWVGFHIYNYILNKFMKGCKTIPMKPIWNMGSNIFGKCRACGCVCLCQLFCYSTNLIFWAWFNDVTWFYMKLQEHHTLSHSKPTSVQGVMGLSSCMHRVTLHSIFPGP
jgi:hypothetical protein